MFQHWKKSAKIVSFLNGRVMLKLHTTANVKLNSDFLSSDFNLKPKKTEILAYQLNNIYHPDSFSFFFILQILSAVLDSTICVQA